MPQMMPINWLISLFFFLFVFILFNMMNYYVFLIKNKYNIKNIFYKKKYLTWKW